MITLERPSDNAARLHKADPDIFPDRLGRILPIDRQPLVFKPEDEAELLKRSDIRSIMTYRGHIYVAHSNAIGPFIGLRKPLGRPAMPCCYKTKEEADQSRRTLKST